MEQDRCGASCLGRAAIAGVSTTVGMTVGASQHVGITAGRKAALWIDSDGVQRGRGSGNRYGREITTCASCA